MNNVVHAESRTITVDPGRILNADFAGVGVNLIPCGLMENNLSRGYNEAYWEMDMKRLLMMKPKLARVWFQVDWMETEKGVYTWNSDKMLAFYKYLDVLQAAGTEVDLDFGWKVGRDIQSWFCIPGATPKISAPNDLAAFAASCSALLNQLIYVKGYTNIKYVSFYNEPNAEADFDHPGDELTYWGDMIQAVHNRLVADELRSSIKILGPDVVHGYDWLRYLKDNKDDCFDVYSFHLYGASYNYFPTAVSPSVNYVSPKPLFITEFGWEGEEDSNWTAGYANNIIAASKNGIGGMTVWLNNGSYLEDPNESTNTNGAFALCDTLYTDLYPKKNFYQVSMMERYIPAHSSVVYTSTTDTDIKTTAFKTSSGDYTIIVECKAGAARNLTVDFSGVNIGKTFGKHVYTNGITKEINALLPARSGTFSAGTSFTDNGISSDYCVIIYTTLPAQTQVEVTPAVYNLNKGATCQLNASVIDNTGGVTWSVASGAGTISSSGLYTAPSDAANNSMIAIKATSNADPSAYGIALLKISASPVTPTPTPAPIPTPEPTGALLFEDDFSGDLGKWVNTSNCSISDGTIYVAHNEAIQAAGYGWQNYVFEADVKIADTCAGLAFRKVDDNNFYMWQYSAVTQRLRLLKKVSGEWYEIRRVPQALDMSLDTWFHTKIEVNGSRIRTYFNGELVDTLTDTQFATGKAGFRQAEPTEAAYFDNVRISEIPGASTPPTPDPTPLPTGLWLGDDFSGDLSNWSNTANCSITDGNLFVTRNETVQSINGGSDWQDYIYEMDFKIAGTCAGLAFRKTDDNNFYMWQFNAATQRMRPMKKVDGVWSQIKSVAYGFNLNTWYHVAIHADGSTIKTYINGNLVDTTVDTQFTSGKVGFRQAGAVEAAYFDNVQVAEIASGTPTPTPTPTPTATPTPTPIDGELFTDGFESNNFTSGGWTNAGCEIVSTYSYEGTYAAGFSNPDTLVKSLSTSGYDNIQVSYVVCTVDCETNDYFISEWYDGSAWNRIEAVTGSTDWTVKTWNLPSGAGNNPNFRLRFRTSNNDSTDYAYLDSVRIIWLQ